ncbi:MAG: TIGR02996 domain-containing protein, partial [Gemmataceae bacterium]|nr:TIGR02996 domain-containing protein [Gemmataceae bacterium]
MTDQEALLAAIFAHPEEDTPRLAYADWLDEQGGDSNAARAAYIRMEIETARNFPGQWTKEKQAALEPGQELFAKHHRDWFPEL